MKKFSPPYKGASPNKITQGFHEKHKAIDIAGKFGVFLVAPFDAKIISIVKAQKLDYSTNELASGCGVLMTAVDDPKERVSYWHCQAVFPVEVGEVVKQGQPVAMMGNTGWVESGGMVISVGERLEEYRKATALNPPKKGVHCHISYGYGDGTADGTEMRDISKRIDWTINIPYDLFSAIWKTFNNITKLLKGQK